MDVNLSWTQCDPFLLWIESFQCEPQDVISRRHALDDETAELGRGNAFQVIIKEYGYAGAGLDLDVSVLCQNGICCDHEMSMTVAWSHRGMIKNVMDILSDLMNPTF